MKFFHLKIILRMRPQASLVSQRDPLHTQRKGSTTILKHEGKDLKNIKAGKSMLRSPSAVSTL